MLDAARGVFIYVLAALLPLAGLILAAVRFAEGDRHEGAMVLAAALLGAFAYLLVLG